MKRKEFKSSDYVSSKSSSIETPVLSKKHKNIGNIILEFEHNSSLVKPLRKRRRRNTSKYKERGNMQVPDGIKIALGSILNANFRDESVVKSFLDNIPNDFKHNVRFDHRRFVNRIAIAKNGGYPDGEKMVNQVICGDAIETLKLIPDESIDCIITSPPYYKLRDYGVEGQYGLENTYVEYLDKLIEVMKQCKRVIKQEGTIWVNLGDTYAHSGANSGRFQNKKRGKFSKIEKNIPSKSAILIPHRFAIRCIDELDLTVRNDIIWAKKNGMPESVQDRFSKKHEFVFFITKSKKYYFDLNGIKDKARPENWNYAKGVKCNNSPDSKYGNKIKTRIISKNREKIINGEYIGKNPGSVSDFWDIPTKPSNSKTHYATFNTELISKPIIAGCPVGGIVLDPFAGTGTTLVRAKLLERRYIGIELNPSYVVICKTNLDRCNILNFSATN